MDAIISGNIFYRHKKKWVRRFCVLVRPNTFSDSVKLLVYTATDSRNQRSTSNARVSPQLLNEFIVYGHVHGIHMNAQDHVMFLVCMSSVECLAFDEFDEMKRWSDRLLDQLNDINQSADLIYADKHSQLRAGLEGRLLLNCSHISFIRSPGNYEPKLLMSWRISDIIQYGWKKADKKNSGKHKSKAYDMDGYNTFIIKASPMSIKAPNLHIFSCTDPKLICDMLERLTANQENSSQVEFGEMFQHRRRCESYSTRKSSFYQDSDCMSPESPGGVSNKFFTESISRMPKTQRFCRSISEVRPSRSRLDSSESIEEEDEKVSDDTYVIEKPEPSPDPNSPVRSLTFTWLERYPYERESYRTNTFRRQFSEDVCSTYRNHSPATIFQESRLLRPRSHNNYCSLGSLRSKLESPPNSNGYSTMISSNPINIPNLSLYIDRDRGLASRRFLNQNKQNFDSDSTNNSVSSYANLEFVELVEQINQYCQNSDRNTDVIC